MSKKPKTLSAKRLAFRTAQISGKNATESARVAKFKHPNKVGHKLAQIPEIKSFVEAHQAVALANAGITGEKVLSETWGVASSDIRQAFNADGTLKAMCDMPESIARCIAGVDVDELFEGSGPDRKQIGVTKKIRLWPKVPALDLVGQNQKLWENASPLSGVPMVINIVPAHNISAPDPGH